MWGRLKSAVREGNFRYTRTSWNGVRVNKFQFNELSELQVVMD